MPDLSTVSNVDDLRSRARRALPRALFDFVDGAAGDETTARHNRADFDRYGFRPRVGRNVSTIDLTATMAGRPAALPMALSPIGFAGLCWPEGEVLAARAAARTGIPACLSTNSIASIEDVARAVPEGENWFQLYFLKDRDWMMGLLRRAKDAGYRALVLTLDLPVAGRRERDVRNAFTVPIRPRLATIADTALRLPFLVRSTRTRFRFGNFEGNPHADGFVSIGKHVSSLFDPSATWEDVARVREAWDGPMIVKGLLQPDDVEAARRIGVQGISVSNHGGRQLDGSLSAVAALPDMVAAAGSDMEVLLDSGVRRGTDILKAHALGASGVLIGRAWAYGLAAAGEAGVDKTIELLRDEMTNGMMLLGERELAALGPSHLTDMTR
ncbi:MAG: alpha-hydroxy acid oxidase [Pseudomonadota bacterium]|nr:alpha-hydroxy acid oxidase [Pseudomonadota bacterium]